MARRGWAPAVAGCGRGRRARTTRCRRWRSAARRAPPPSPGQPRPSGRSGPCRGRSWMRRTDEHGRWRRLRVGWGESHLALDCRNAYVLEAQAERDAEVLQHLPRLPERLLQRDGRPQELDAALEVRVAALLLGEGGGGQHDGGAIPLQSGQVIPGGEELHRRGDSGSRRRTPAEQRLDAVEAVPAGDAYRQRAALVGAAVQGELLAAHLLRQVAAGAREVVDVLAAVAVAEQDGHGSARILQQIVRRE